MNHRALEVPQRAIRKSCIYTKRIYIITVMSSWRQADGTSPFLN